MDVMVPPWIVTRWSGRRSAAGFTTVTPERTMSCCSTTRAAGGRSTTSTVARTATTTSATTTRGETRRDIGRRLWRFGGSRVDSSSLRPMGRLGYPTGMRAALVFVFLFAAPAAFAKPSPAAPVAPLAAAGRWLVDATGRTVLLHGVNDVEKSPPFYPAAAGLGDDDAAFLAAEGFDALRLGVDFRGLMPAPGEIDDAYIEHLAETVAAFGGRGLFVLLDFHQDGFAPMFNGNGLPDWMAITDGLPNPPEAVFPLYYIQNPAMQRAFENFWMNHEGPNGIGLQDYFVQGLERVVERFADNERVIGTELMNEPWPGSVWQPCIDMGVGCPDLEATLLVPFYEKASAAARRIAPEQLVFVEPFVLFNFGQGPTSIPG